MHLSGKPAPIETNCLSNDTDSVIPFLCLPIELRWFVWCWTFPETQIIFIRHGKHRTIPDSPQIDTIPRPPVALHICKESRHIALKHYKLYFVQEQNQNIIRAVYFHPERDILFLDLVYDFAAFPVQYPETNEIFTIAIPTTATDYIWDDESVYAEEDQAGTQWINWKTQFTRAKTLLVTRSRIFAPYDHGCTWAMFEKELKQFIIKQRANGSQLRVKVVSL